MRKAASTTTAEEPAATLAPKQAVRALSPYSQGKSSAEGFAEPIKLSSNESPLGPSPRAIAAYHDAAARLFRYPDGGQSALRKAIGDIYGLDPTRIVCGNGSEELQLLLVRAFVSPSDEVICSEFSFIMGRIHAEAQGATIVTAPEVDYRADADAILARITPKTRMIMLASPNNPVGDYMRRCEFERLVENTPKHVIIIYDGAYADYVDASDYDNGFALCDRAPNVVITRTFSKLYGLAGLRIGWMYADKSVIDAIERIRTPFNTNIAALAAAEAAVRDTDYSAKVKAHNAIWLSRLTTTLRDLGYEVFPSVANFYLIRFSANGDFTADQAAEFLLKRGVIPRPVSAGGPAGCLRITVGLDHENEAVIDALKEFAAHRAAARSV
ncbi:MAG: histidinol-phosphate transaminase [Caulobacterales bacterium]|nr:histidinol-phosphate transaminase [Caulobacterales bacterium]